MKTVRLFIILSLVFLLCDCKKEYLDGDEFYDIELEKELLLVGGDSVSVNVKSKRYGWSITSVETRENGEVSEIENILRPTPPNGQDFKDTMQGDWFQVIKITSTELQVNLSPNPTSNYRELTVFLQGALAWRDSLQVVQRGK